ncbi:RluA family pseudouridine synthase [Jeotgalibacillus marinus]|uniref:Pseudouridine synthase n=1 Tax=Jeotgalibacillus marinus TaxID=86667 RepID=A0ABV3Q6Y8_9BACL
MKPHTFTINIPHDLVGITIEEALKTYWGFSKKTIHQWRMDKAIDLNGELTQWKVELASFDRLSIRLSEEAQTYPATDLAILPLYEDDHLLIVNKPAGMDTHPNSPANTNTLANGVVHYLMSKGHNGYAQPIHRLDRDTTGAILFAKHSAVKPLLDRLLEQRLIKRTYWALVEGEMKKNSGTIKDPIGNDRHHNTRKRISPNGQHAITHFKKINFKEDLHVTWLELKLDTGRTHQIRVHLSYLGHPLAGDELYGGKKSPDFMAQALHAVRLSFKHPLTSEIIDVKAPELHVPPRFN